MSELPLPSEIVLASWLFLIQWFYLLGVGLVELGYWVFNGSLFLDPTLLRSCEVIGFTSAINFLVIVGWAALEGRF